MMKRNTDVSQQAPQSRVVCCCLPIPCCGGLLLLLVAIISTGIHLLPPLMRLLTLPTMR